MDAPEFDKKINVLNLYRAVVHAESIGKIRLFLVTETDSWIVVIFFC